MEPMKPMDPMKPMSGGGWWPKDLGSPSSSGGQNDLRYAFFPNKRRLLIDRAGKVSTYDTGDLQIGGVQQGGGGGDPTFSSQKGPVDLSSLKKLD